MGFIVGARASGLVVRRVVLWLTSKPTAMGWLQVEATKKAHLATGGASARGDFVRNRGANEAEPGIAVLAGHGIVLAKDGLHGGEVGLKSR